MKALRLGPQQRYLILRLLEAEWRKLDDASKALGPNDEGWATVNAEFVKVTNTAQTFRVWSGAQAELEHLDDMVDKVVEGWGEGS